MWARYLTPAVLNSLLPELQRLVREMIDKMCIVTAPRADDGTLIKLLRVDLQTGTVFKDGMCIGVPAHIKIATDVSTRQTSASAAPQQQQHQLQQQRQGSADDASTFFTQQLTDVVRADGSAPAAASAASSASSGADAAATAATSNSDNPELRALYTRSVRCYLIPHDDPLAQVLGTSADNCCGYFINGKEHICYSRISALPIPSRALTVEQTKLIGDMLSYQVNQHEHREGCLKGNRCYCRFAKEAVRLPQGACGTATFIVVRTYGPSIKEKWAKLVADSHHSFAKNFVVVERSIDSKEDTARSLSRPTC